MELKSNHYIIFHSFTTLFSPLGLSPRAVSTSFGCRQNIAICLQGASSPDPTTVYVDLRALRYISFRAVFGRLCKKVSSFLENNVLIEL